MGQGIANWGLRTISPVADVDQPDARTRVSTRLVSIDIVRGYAMLFMLLSHTSDDIPNLDFHTAFRWDMVTSVQLQSITDWIGFFLHISSPIFFLFAGLSLAFFVESRLHRQWAPFQITRFLVIRGLVLIAIDQLVLNWQFTTFQYYPYFGVLFTIGVCIIIISMLWRYKTSVIVGLAVLLLLGVQAYHYFGLAPQNFNILYVTFLGYLHQFSPVIDTTFPVLAWLPIILFGFACGRLVKEGRIRLLSFSWKATIVLFSLWAIIRALGGFGNFYTEHPLIFTKVPPDLAYFSFYLAGTFFLLWLHTRFVSLSRSFLANALLVFGQTALFFYTLHEKFILNIVTRLVSGLNIDQPLMIALLSFLISAVILYFLCYRYRDLRRKYPDSVLKYF